NEWQNGNWTAWAGPNFGINTGCNNHTDPGAFWDWSHYMNLINGGGSSAFKVSDFDGDGKTDTAVFRPANSTWYIWGSSVGTWTRKYGAQGDIPVPTDYDGDSKTDTAVFRPSTATWYIWGSTVGTWTRQYGAQGDIPVPTDYDG